MKIFKTSDLIMDFSEITKKAQATKEYRDKLDLLQIKNFNVSEDIIKKMKENLENWRKLYTNYYSDEVSVSRTYKEILLVNNKKTYYSV